jgi:hypothetical protein
MSDGKISLIKFVVPPEGTDFGSDIPFEVQTKGVEEGVRIDLRLCNSYRGNKGDSGGNISVTVKDNVARGKCRVPLHQDWNNDKAEKQKRPLVEFWYSGKIGFSDKEYSGEKIKVPTKESRQDFVFQHISTDGFASMRITGNCVKDAIEVRSPEALKFHTSKSATDSFDLHIEDHNDMWDRFSAKPVKLSLNDHFLKSGEPISIVHANLTEDRLKSTNANSNVLIPVALAAGMKQEDPIIITTIKFPMPDGKYTLSEISNSKRESLYESLHLGDVVPDAVAIKEAYPFLKDFINGEKFYIKKYKGFYYIIFKGHSALRHYLKGPRYCLENSKIALLTVAKSPGNALKSAIQWSEGSSLAMVFIGTMDIVEWMGTDEGQKYFSDVIVDLSSDVFKTVLSMELGALAGLLLAKATDGVVVVTVGADVGTAIVIGGFLTFLDNRYHLTKQVEEKGRKCDKALQDLFGQLFVKPFSSFLYQLEKDASSAQGAWMP